MVVIRVVNDDVRLFSQIKGYIIVDVIVGTRVRIKIFVTRGLGSGVIIGQLGACVLFGFSFRFGFLK